jgi:hypothetical protein
MRSSGPGTGSTQPREYNRWATWKEMGLERREYGRMDPSRWTRATPYPQKLALTSQASSGRSVGIVRSRTQAKESVSEWLELKSSGSCLENRHYGRRDCHVDCVTPLYPQKLALTSQASGGSSVGIFRSQTQAKEFACLIDENVVQQVFSKQFCFHCNFINLPNESSHLLKIYSLNINDR